MSFQSQPSLRGTLQQLKEIVTVLQGEDHESARLLGRMDTLVSKIEQKIRRKETNKDSAMVIKPAPSAVQAMI